MVVTSDVRARGYIVLGKTMYLKCGSFVLFYPLNTAICSVITYMIVILSGHRYSPFAKCMA